MKKRTRFLALISALALLAAGCGTKKEEKPIVYSNLSEQSIRYDLDSLLKTAGVSDQQRFIFFDHVDQINQVVTQAHLTDGFTPLGEPMYDPYQVQEDWMEAYPDFMGYNCRITSFTLFDEKYLKMPSDVRAENTDNLLFDLEALRADASAFPGREDRFQALFSQVPTENTKDVKVHAENLLMSWQQRGIAFVDDPRIRMINVVFHSQLDGPDTLFIGHSGILLPTPDGDLWFVEKLSFQEPYQVVRFENRKQLQTCLMDRYDVEQGQPTAKPFILENDHLLEP